MADLPVGWDDRHNQMSEKDIKLGGMAAKSFGGTARRNAYNTIMITTVAIVDIKQVIKYESIT